MCISRLAFVQHSRHIHSLALSPIWHWDARGQRQIYESTPQQNMATIRVIPTRHWRTEPPERAPFGKLCGTNGWMLFGSRRDEPSVDFICRVVHWRLNECQICMNMVAGADCVCLCSMHSVYFYANMELFMMGEGWMWSWCSAILSCGEWNEYVSIARQKWPRIYGVCVCATMGYTFYQSGQFGWMDLCVAGCRRRFGLGV